MNRKDTIPPIDSTMDAMDAVMDTIDLKLNNRDVVLAVSHSNYLISLGGTEKVIIEEQEALKTRHLSYIQFYARYPTSALSVQTAADQPIGVNVDSVPLASMTLLQLMMILRVMVDRGRIQLRALHIHHLMNMSLTAMRFFIDTLKPLPVRFFVHDYYSVCRSFTLLNHDNVYCGVGSPAPCRCDDCELFHNADIHRANMGVFLGHVRPEVVAPSETAASIWSHYFPDLADNTRIVPHQMVDPVASNDSDGAREQATTHPLRIAYMGYDQVNKGMEAWWRLCGDYRLQRSFDFYHFGTAGEKLPNVNCIPVSFQDHGPNAMIDALVRHRIDVAFLWSIWPETYSFTFFEALAAGCFVVTNRYSGNIRVQVENWGCGSVFDTENEMLAFLADGRNIRNAVGVGNRQCDNRFTLRFNPQIASEIKHGMSPQAVPIEGAMDGRTCRERALTNGYALLTQFSEPANEKKIEIDETRWMREQLAVYQLSRLHRIVESLRTWFALHPGLSRRVRPVFARLSHYFLQLYQR